jgi:hypothetical protein
LHVSIDRNFWNLAINYESISQIALEIILSIQVRVFELVQTKFVSVQIEFKSVQTNCISAKVSRTWFYKNLRKLHCIGATMIESVQTGSGRGLYRCEQFLNQCKKHINYCFKNLGLCIGAELL